MPKFMSLAILALGLLPACQKSKKNSAPDNGLDFKPGVPLELVEGISGGSTICTDDAGKVHHDFDVSDLKFRVLDGTISTEENIGCPPKIKRTTRTLQAADLAGLRLELTKLVVSVAGQKACIPDGTFSGIRTGPDTFVHVTPHSETVCEGELRTEADWDKLLSVFARSFQNAKE